MVTTRISRDLDRGGDATSREARHRLRACCLLVLNAVRLLRGARGNTDSQPRAAELELDRVSHQVKQRLYNLVEAARQEHLQGESGRDHRLRRLFSFRSSAILSQLCPDDFHATAQSLLNDYIELREWFFEGTAFKEWQNDGPWYLYCYGEPRCGKSTFAAAVARELKTQYSDDPQRAVVSLFLGHGENKQRYTTSHGVLGAILKQLVESKLQGDGHSTILDQLSTAERKLLSNSPDLLKQSIVKELAGLDKMFLVVDGLDTPSAEDGSYSLQDDLVDLLALVSSLPCALRLMLVETRTDTFGPNSFDEFATCDAMISPETKCGAECEDPYWTCEQCDKGFYMCQDCYAQDRHCSISSHILKVKVEIRSELSTYIDAKLSSMNNTTQIGRRMYGALGISQHVQEDINYKAGGIFVVAKLYMDSLIEQQSIEEVLDILDRLPVYQRLYYNSLMFEITSQTNEHRTLALAALALVAASENGIAMTFDEIKEAISHLTDRDDLNLTDSQFLKCTKGLLTLPDAVTTFHESASVYLAQECGEILANHNINLGSLCIKAIRTFMGKAVLGRNTLPEDLMSLLNDNPFFAYACRNWGTNLRLASTDESKEACLTFLDEDYERQAGFQQMMLLATNNVKSNGIWAGGNQLHAVVWFGLVDTLQQNRDRKAQSLDTNAKDSLGRTPLHLACSQGNQGVASILLDMGADPLIEDCEGRTPIWEAIECGDLATLDVILRSVRHGKQFQRVLNARNPHFGDQTPLMLAIQRPHDNQDEIDSMLLEHHDLNLNIQDSVGRTALHVAANMGYYNGLQLLTESSKYVCIMSLDPDLRDTSGRTAAIAALTAGYKADDGVAKLLAFLQRPQNRTIVNAVDKNGRSLLHYAATDEDYQPIVEYLKEVQADVNVPDAHMRTPLHIAAAQASPTGEHNIIRLLLEMQADLQAEDEQGLTPYDLAMQQGAEWADELLPNDQATQRDQPFIFWPDAINNTEAFFEKIPTLPDSLLRQADPVGYTLLHCAAESGDDATVKLLLRKDVDVNAQTQTFATALHLALGNMEIITLLLAHPDIDLDLVDYQGKAPLECALDQDTNDLDHKFGVAIALIRRGARIVLPKPRRQAILNYALAHDEILDGNLDVVKTLLNSGASLFLYCRPGLLPSETARADGASEKTIELLREREREAVEKLAKK